jgi:hypothetical protein
VEDEDVPLSERDQNLYGMDRELHEKVTSKFSDQEWLDALHWVEKLTGMELDGGSGSGDVRFWKGLRNGVALCTLMNRIKPGTIPKVHSAGIALQEIENIKLFIAALRDYGVPSHETFSQSDLYERKFLTAVLVALNALSRTAQSLGFEGEVLGVRIINPGLAYGAVAKSRRWSVQSNKEYYNKALGTNH